MHRFGWWRTGVWYVLALVILVLDQWTKHLVAIQLDLGSRVQVWPFLDITYAHNPGAAFSLLADAGGWQRHFLVTVALVVSVILVVWLARLSARERLLAAALSLLLGGALGNLVDRLRLGYVEDFILVHWQTWHFPAFNLADTAITLGAILLIIDAFRPGGGARETNSETQ